MYLELYQSSSLSMEWKGPTSAWPSSIDTRSLSALLKINTVLPAHCSIQQTGSDISLSLLLLNVAEDSFSSAVSS
jgi:hypothetical protein